MSFSTSVLMMLSTVDEGVCDGKTHGRRIGGGFAQSTRLVASGDLGVCEIAFH